MKKRYIIMIIAICTILSLLASCDGSVDEKLFAKDGTQERDWANISFDGLVFVYADENWNIVSETPLTSAFAKTNDGLSYDGKVVRYEPDESTEAKNIYIKTGTYGYTGNGKPLNQYVIINAPNATIRHYGSAEYTEINATSYYLYGAVGDLVVYKDNVSIESNASVDDFSVANGATGADLTIKVEKPENIGVFAYYQSETDEVKVNGKDPSIIFDDDSLAKISSAENKDVARIGKVKYDSIPSSSDSKDVIRIVKDFNITSDYSLGSTENKDETLRVGAGVELKVSGDNGRVTVYGILENFGTISVNTEKTIDVENELNNYGTLDNLGEVPIGATPSNPAALTNYGTINNLSSGTVTVNSKKFLNNYGTLDNSGTVTVSGTLYNYCGTISGASSISNVTQKTLGD